MPPSSLPSTPAERQHQYRQRQRDGVRVVRNELRPYVIAALIKGGWLSKTEARDRETLEAAVSDLIDCWARGALQAVLRRLAEVMGRTNMTTGTPGPTSVPASNI